MRNAVSSTNMHTLFFSLIRLSIGTNDSLSRQPSVEEWSELYRMAMKQSLVGICFVGVRKYMETAKQSGEKTSIPLKVYYQWLGTAAQIQQRNELMNRRCVELQTKLCSSGLKSSILKGQGVAALYHSELKNFRQSGDIDVYVDCNREKSIEYAKSIGQDSVNWDYKHLHLKIFEDTAVEMHYRPEVLLNLVKNNKLQKWFKTKESLALIFQQNEGLVTPSVVFNKFYILLHIYRHFFYEGIGLRQLMDYYFVLRAAGHQDDNSIVQETIEKFGMKRFAEGIMWIMLHVFGLEKHYLLYAPNEKEGQYILSQIMEGGNFGHHDRRLKADRHQGKYGAVKKILRHNLHLVTRYPSETVWAPVWIVYHWCWKKWVR